MHSHQKLLGARGERFFADYLPKRLGWKLRRIYNDKTSQKLYGDFQFDTYTRNGLNVDSKIELMDSPFFPVEMMQCVRKKQLGWFHYAKKCHAIAYAQVCKDDENKTWGVWFRSIYLINLERLRQLDLDRYREVETKRGYGVTLLRLVPISNLVDQHIAWDIYTQGHWYDLTM